jgi:hypothetical protein
LQQQSWWGRTREGGVKLLGSGGLLDLNYGDGDLLAERDLHSTWCRCSTRMLACSLFSPRTHANAVGRVFLGYSAPPWLTTLNKPSPGKGLNPK